MSLGKWQRCKRISEKTSNLQYSLNVSRRYSINDSHANVLRPMMTHKTCQELECLKPRGIQLRTHGISPSVKIESDYQIRGATRSIVSHQLCLHFTIQPLISSLLSLWYHKSIQPLSATDMWLMTNNPRRSISAQHYEQRNGIQSVSFEHFVTTVSHLSKFASTPYSKSSLMKQRCILTWSSCSLRGDMSCRSRKNQ